MPDVLSSQNRRGVVVNPDGTTSLQEDATGHFRRLLLWVLMLGAIALAGFVWIGNTKTSYVANIPALAAVHDTSSHICTNVVRIIHELFGAM